MAENIATVQDDIARLDSEFDKQRSSQLSFMWNDNECYVLSADTPSDIYSALKRNYRLATLQEVARIRIHVDNTHPAWSVRATTSTHLLRSLDGNYMLFPNLDMTDSSYTDILQSFHSTLSDGGIRYPDRIVRDIQRDPSVPRLSMEEYLHHPGGSFTGAQLLEHKVFATSFGNEELYTRYVRELLRLSIGTFYQPGRHSGWTPQSMEPGFGRPIALGFGETMWYPPNNSSEGGHGAIAVPKQLGEVKE